MFDASLLSLKWRSVRADILCQSSKAEVETEWTRQGRAVPQAGGRVEDSFAEIWEEVRSKLDVNSGRGTGPPATPLRGGRGVALFAYTPPSGHACLAL